MVNEEGELVESWGVDRREAEAIYDAGREVVVEVLLLMNAQIQALTARLERKLPSM